MTEKNMITEKRTLPDRRLYDYLNHSSLAPEERSRYDRRKHVRRRKTVRRKNTSPCLRLPS